MLVACLDGGGAALFGLLVEETHFVHIGPKAQLPARFRSGRASAAHEMGDHGDHRHDEQDVDQRAGNLEDEKPAQPQDDQNHGDDCKHGIHPLLRLAPGNDAAPPQPMPDNGRARDRFRRGPYSFVPAQEASSTVSIKVRGLFDRSSRKTSFPPAFWTPSITRVSWAVKAGSRA